jgi:hypothetical protein
MTTTVRIAAVRCAESVSPSRPAAAVTGALFIITFLTSIPALLLFGPVLNDPAYIVGAGADTQISLGAFLELLLIIANIGTALALFPILTRENEAVALGYVTARVTECVFIAVGILCVLSVVTLRQAAAGADAAALVVAGEALVAVKDWTFVLGPGFVVGVGNGLLLGFLMYRSGLVPRPMALLGLAGGPLVCASGVAVLFGIIEAGSVWQFASSVPEMLWEVSLGLYLTVKGFRPAPIIATEEAARLPSSAVAEPAGV